MIPCHSIRFYCRKARWFTSRGWGSEGWVFPRWLCASIGSSFKSVRPTRTPCWAKFSTFDHLKMMRWCEKLLVSFINILCIEQWSYPEFIANVIQALAHFGQCNLLVIYEVCTTITQNYLLHNPYGRIFVQFHSSYCKRHNKNSATFKHKSILMHTMTANFGVRRVVHIKWDNTSIQ